VVTPLVIFDVDGTLCDTYSVDDECFCETASEVLGVRLRPSSWEESPHITDSGIVEWLWMRHRRRPPTDREVEMFVAQFEGALTRELERAPSRFSPIPGAAPFLALLQASGWRSVFATGGWAKTARLKLRAAGLPVEPLLASSDDSHDRAEIFKVAHARAVAVAPQPGRPVLVGDGIWDIRVASRFGWPFVGVGEGQRGELLRNAGASVVIPNFADLDASLGVLLDCEVPRPMQSSRGPGE